MRFPSRLTTLALVPLLIVWSSCAQSTVPRAGNLDDFFGIPWLTSPSSAIAALAKTQHTEIDSVAIDSSLVLLKGGIQFGMPVQTWTLFFSDQRLWGGGIDFQPKLVGDVLPTYRAVKARLDSIYGPPDILDNRVDLSQDDRTIRHAIRDDPDGLKATWKFSRVGSTIPDGIILTIMKGSDISVVYLRGDLAKAAVLKRNRTKR